ncbi:DUF1998 domain-containing protein [Photobacterium leiognathi]|uniref:DUF1998 domain-containing protein n=1 Tax=Photobacterium leiognathi TaxID=553611 RepID=UPI0027358A42|nr:DUF1998 domain-containing protein [Photobacterium leiognathi]
MSSFRNKKRLAPKKKYPEGMINLSQSINTFGIGSMLEIRSQKGQQTRTTSAIVCGLDSWPVDRLPSVSEPDLCKLLGVDELKSPPSGDDNTYVPAKRFPRWLECSQCHRLGIIGKQFEEKQDGIPSCASNNCSGWGIPTRLVSVCFNPGKQGGVSKHHLDDFPWEYWAHKNSKFCEQPRLWLESKEKKTGLDGLVVHCDCGANNSLSGALSEKALERISCRGNRPWLREPEACSHHVRGLLRGASNVYFPVTASTISIPPNSSRLLQLLNRVEFKNFTQLYLKGELTAKNVVEMFAKFSDFSSFDDEQVEKALEALKNSVRSARTEAERKAEEREALLVNYPEDDFDDDSQGSDDFELEVISSNEIGEVNQSAAKIIEQVSLVHRLREVIAFRGFTRLESPMTSNRFASRCAPISMGFKGWLPAIENKGEGIYIEIDQKALAIWEKRPEVIERMGLLSRNYLRSSQGNAMDGDVLEPTARLVMLHTLSHLLIRQLSLECGYSSASLKERIYCADDYCGVLISTASAASDGTLGGLVRQGKPKNFVNTLINALRDAEWCSSDPLCIDSEGQGSEALNLAACHACALVSETSCELRNMFLDRGLVIGTLDNPSMGLFSDLLV